jgi:hypothetical protein
VGLFLLKPSSETYFPRGKSKGFIRRRQLR